MTLYLEATTTIPDLFIDYIEVRLASGESASLRSDTPNSRKRSNVANYPMSSMVSFERTDFFAAASAPMQPVKPWTNTLPA